MSVGHLYDLFGEILMSSAHFVIGLFVTLIFQNLLTLLLDLTFSKLPDIETWICHLLTV